MATKAADLAQSSFENRASAVALAYQGEDSVPRVVAKGHGLIAQEIIDRAREAGIYVHESRELVALLMQVDLDQAIPQELYIAVAELLAWLYTLEQEGQVPPTLPLHNDIVRKTTNA
jgi:flagellar biosynthesis protein